MSAPDPVRPDPARPAARLLGFDLARGLALEHSRANVVVVLVHRGVLALLLLPIVRLRAGAVAVVGLLGGAVSVGAMIALARPDLVPALVGPDGTPGPGYPLPALAGGL